VEAGHPAFPLDGAIIPKTLFSQAGISIKLQSCKVNPGHILPGKRVRAVFGRVVASFPNPGLSDTLTLH